MNPLDSFHPRETHVKQECFELLARDTENAVIFADAERRIEWVNDAFTRICGYTRNEVKGRNPAFLQGERTDPKTVDRMRKALNEGRRVKEKVLNYTKLGDEYVADLEIIPRRDEQGALAGFVAVAWNIEGHFESNGKIQSHLVPQSAISDASLDGLLILDRQGGIVDVNPAYCRMTGYRIKELLGRNISDLEMDASKSLIASHIRLAVDRVQDCFGAQLSRKDGSAMDVQVSIRFDNKDKSYVLFFKDISDRKVALQKIARLTTLYRAINECNEAILYSKSRIELFQDICRIVVCLGNMKMAWVGKPDPSSGLIQPLASYGEGKEYLTNILISANPEIPEGRGPAGSALREKRPVWCDDFANNPMTLPWQERAAHYGWKSAASIPFSLVGRHDEVLTFYGGYELGFGDDVKELLIRMVKNISFALDQFVP